jgi:hypothetical protein
MSRLDIVRVVAAVESTLWIGGGQWAGKSTVAHLLSARYPLLRYVYDYHDARSHASRARSEPTRFPSFDAFLAQLERDPSAVWVDATPEQMVEQAEAIFEERFEMVLEDLQAAPGELVVLAEGWVGAAPGSRRPVSQVPRPGGLSRCDLRVSRATGCLARACSLGERPWPLRSEARAAEPSRAGSHPRRACRRGRGKARAPGDRCRRLRRAGCHRLEGRRAIPASSADLALLNRG